MRRGLVGLGAFGAEEHASAKLLPFLTEEYGGFQYRTLPVHEAGITTWWLGAFAVRKVEERGNALVATAEWEPPGPVEPLGQKKTLLTWEDIQRRSQGHATILVPMPSWDGATPLMVVPGTIEVWATRDIQVAASVADPNKPSFAFVIAPPKDGWRVGQDAALTMGSSSSKTLPYVIGAVGVVAAAGTVYWLATRKK